MQKEITIIVPTYNEEDKIENCLQSIFSQKLELIDKVVVADNHSTDGTVNLCKKFDVQVISGGKPAAARNNGARSAAGNYLLFIDADTVLPHHFLEKALKIFKNSRYSVASFFIKPDPRDFFNTILFNAYNIVCLLIAKISLPTIGTAGCCILVEKEIHNHVSGFNENMIVLEEYDYIKRIKRFGKFGVIPIAVSTSTRRFQRGTRLKQAIILFIYYSRWLFTGRVNHDKLGYWQRYDKK
jgi:glycosyltransferase involved in cell wall biosynthesis